jgi:DNA polymerase-3 subunit alpha
LRLHYPAHFAAALLTSEASEGTQEAVVRYARCARADGIRILGPDVNRSQIAFAVDDDGAVRWGLMGIRGLGEAHLAPIVAGQPYSSFYDLVARTHLNAKSLQILVEAGACDGWGLARERLVDALAMAVARQRQATRDDVSGQTTMALGADEEYPAAKAWSLPDSFRRQFTHLYFFPGPDHPLAHGPSDYGGGSTIRGLVTDVHVHNRVTKMTIEDACVHKLVVFFAPEDVPADVGVGYVATFWGQERGDEFLADGGRRDGDEIFAVAGKKQRRIKNDRDD